MQSNRLNKVEKFDRKAYQIEWRKKNKGYDQSYYAKNKEKIKDINKNCYYKSEYGMTLEDYNIMLFEQDGCCAICNTHHTELKQTLAVDHCHTTGKVRGLLCQNCNTALGKFKDNIQLIKQSIKYLQNGKFRK